MEGNAMKKIDPNIRDVYILGLCLLGGMAGALANSLVVWLFGYLEISKAM